MAANGNECELSRWVRRVSRVDIFRQGRGTGYRLWLDAANQRVGFFALWLDDRGRVREGREVKSTEVPVPALEILLGSASDHAGRAAVRIEVVR